MARVEIGIAPAISSTRIYTGAARRLNELSRQQAAIDLAW